jgi:tight adherence protein C
MIAPAVIGALLGAGLGLSLFLTLFALMPATPALGPILHPQLATTARRNGRLWRGVQQRLSGIAPQANLRVLGKTPGEFVTNVVLSGLIGLALPGMLAALLAAIGLRIGTYLPLGICLVVAAAFVWMVYNDVSRKADAARRECRRAVCSYLDLVAAKHANGHGATESLMGAARLGHGWVFVRIRERLLQAQMDSAEPWEGLRQMSRELGVPELGSISEIMQAAGRSGASVYQSLRARAAALRKQVLNEDLTVAASRTTAMEAPVALILLMIMVLAMYPYIAGLSITPVGR